MEEDDVLAKGIETDLEKRCTLVDTKSVDNGKRGKNTERTCSRRGRYFVPSRNINGQVQFKNYCRYYRYGRCTYGENCRYLHEKPVKDATSTRNGHAIGHTLEAESKTDILPEDGVASTNKAETQDSTIQKPKKIFQRAFRPPVARPSLVFEKQQSGSEEQKSARQREITYFQRRFPGTKLYEASESVLAVEFTYKVIGSDWPFDVRAVACVLKLPAGYPVEKAHLKLAEPFLPPTLVIHIEKEANSFLATKYQLFESKNAFEPVGRLLVRWLDKRILDLFIEGLKKTKMVVEAESAGISLIMPSDDNHSHDNSTAKESQHRQTDGSEMEDGTEVEKESLEPSGPSKTDQGSQVFDEESPSLLSEMSVERNMLDKKTKDIIEVRVNWSNASGNIASLSASSLAFQIKCLKCSCNGFITCYEKQLATSHCKRCRNRQSIMLESRLVHEFSNIIAVLEPKGCRPVDCILLSSSFTFTCLNCNRSSIAENLAYGTAHKTWCRDCHARCEFSIDSVRFFGNFQSIATEDLSLKKIEVKKKKVDKTMMIEVGSPLPEYGTCKHYKKSFRWFRFPCCGKLYPCDICHDDVETEHEMKLGNRMICGFCSHEQPFLANKPCAFCKNSVVNVRSSFWEGGRGCRDRTRMNRKDRRKYVGSAPKVAPKKQNQVADS